MQVDMSNFKKLKNNYDAQTTIHEPKKIVLRIKSNESEFWTCVYISNFFHLKIINNFQGPKRRVTVSKIAFLDTTLIKSVTDLRNQSTYVFITLKFNIRSSECVTNHLFYSAAPRLQTYSLQKPH